MPSLVLEAAMEAKRHNRNDIKRFEAHGKVLRIPHGVVQRHRFSIQ